MLASPSLLPPSPTRRAADGGSRGLVPREPDYDALEVALETVCSDATPDTKDELRRIARYRAPFSATGIDLPKNKLAAVLVFLHLNTRGELSVTLTTRSSHLRSHPGETALPGGRWEEGDGEGGVWTAYREAHEEIGLPLPPRESVFPSASSTFSPSPAPNSPPTSHLLHLTTLPPFTSRTLLAVLPVVALLLEPAATAAETYLPQTLRPSPDEVAAVFHLPLRAFLLRPALPDDGEPAPVELEHSHHDYTWLLSRPYRLHIFTSARSSPTPLPSAVTGLTADIVLQCAMLAESGGEREPGFERRARGQMRWEETVRVALGMPRGERVGLVERVQEGEMGAVRRAERGEGEEAEREPEEHVDR